MEKFICTQCNNPIKQPCCEFICPNLNPKIKPVKCPLGKNNVLWIKNKNEKEEE